MSGAADNTDILRAVVVMDLEAPASAAWLVVALLVSVCKEDILSL
jgi:hypothetical protein